MSMNKFQQKRKAKKIWACLSSYKSQESSVLTYRNSLETSIFNLGDTLYIHINSCPGFTFPRSSGNINQPFHFPSKLIHTF